MLIYKIFRAPEWAEFRTLGQTRGAPTDLADGYIHFSTRAQLVETCQKHFAGARGLILAALESEDLAHDLKWEPSRGGALFPHLYRHLRMQDVIWHSDLPPGADGHVFPKGVL